MAMVGATVANGGIAYQPSLIYQIQRADGTIVQRPPKVRGDLTKDNGLTKDQIEMVRKGMWEVVNAPDGTGKKARVPGVVVAGKTGTAQFWRDGQKDDHTWFVAFAPYDQPKVALAVLVQGGKSGGDVAAPLASKILEETLSLDHGYDPGLQPMDPAIGNFKQIEAINFKVPAAPAATQLASNDQETSDHVATVSDAPTHHASRSHQDEPDIRSEAETHQPTARAQPAQPQRRSFFDFFRHKSRPEQNNQQAPQQTNQQPKKKRFLFF
jgi:penicillin-binding protein 2